MATRQKGIKWDVAGTIPKDTDWFDSDVQGRADKPTEDVINFLLDEDARVNLSLTFDGITKAGVLNEGKKINKGEPFEVRLTIYPGMTYNFQHQEDKLINVAVFIVTEVVE